MDLRINDYYNAGSVYNTGRLYMMTHTAASDSVTAVTPVKKVAPVVSGTPAAIYEVSEKKDLKPTYSINKMSKEQRASVVAQLKADQEARANQLTDLVSNMMIGQSNTLAKSDDIWKFLAKGNFTVTPEVKAQEAKPQEAKAPAKEEKKPEIAPNGAVLLDNPIPHPARKTEHKNMEYDINVDDSSLHYDINISDNDDFDV